MNTKNKTILSRSPSVFTDRKLWQEFCGYFKTEAEALAAMDGGPWITVVGVKSYQDVIESEKKKLRQQMRKDLKDQLINGSLHAVGFLNGSTEMEYIRPELWNYLKFNFRNSTAEGEGYKYLGVEITDVHPKKRNELEDDCTLWMQNMREQYGYMKKNILYDLAIKRFGNGLTTRIFNNAYARAFETKRGGVRKTAANRSAN